MLAAARRLPGIDVGLAPPPAVEALPRMDVAVFVGFARTGPLHVPVVLESAREFGDVFGADAPLAWDEARGERVTAWLGPAVRAFFSNGGRRCWVIRVADPERARANDFEVPGVLAVGPGQAPARAARARARSEGSWSDSLRLSAAVSRTGFAIEGLSAAGSPGSGRWVLETRAALRPGDLVEIGDARADAVVAKDEAPQTVAYAVVERVRSGPALGEPFVADVSVTAAFERLPDAWSVAVSSDLEPGRWALQESSPGPVWMRVDRVERVASGTKASGPRWRELAPELPVVAGEVRRGHVASLDLRVTGGLSGRLDGVGLTPAHRAAWWGQVSDADFHRPPADDGPRRRPPGDGTRFSLCREDGPPPAAWVPLGVRGVFDAFVGPLAQPGTALERDGLARFDRTLFLDPELADTPTSGLLALADGIRYVRPQPRSLLGLHAALSIGGGGPFTEASLIAVPDAVHVGWQRRDEGPPLPPRPAEPPTPSHWRTHRGDCVAADSTPLEGPDFGAFLDCRTRQLPSPVLSGPEGPVPPGVHRLAWTASEPGAVYELVESTQPDLGEARVVYSGPRTEHVALTEREGVYYYRAFALSGDERSAGSNAVAVRVRADDYRLNRPEESGPVEPEWVAVHRAALRLAAATGELFAVLAMPRHFRTPEALRYAGRLRAELEPRETRALSYGALYFPWVQSDARPSSGTVGRPERVRGGEGAPLVVPPDGPATGVLAGRASLRGAWIAPANEPISDVVALSPDVPAADRAALQEAQVNLLRADPRGFLALSADTLSPEPEVRPVNVRRLLTLLRRLALRRGTSYVFEPNGGTLRRSVERGFELMLTDLFRRGAFAGATPAQSFRVVTDESLNRLREAEAGRFFVELRVAPSLPARFIAVRLAQSGPRLTVTEEL